MLVKVHLPCGRKRCFRMAVAREPRSHHSMTTTMRTSVGASSRTSRTSSGHPRPEQRSGGAVRAGVIESTQTLRGWAAPPQSPAGFKYTVPICPLSSPCNRKRNELGATWGRRYELKGAMQAAITHTHTRAPWRLRTGEPKPCSEL